MKLRAVAISTFLGLLSATALIWAVFSRLDRWQAWAFVTLLYTALAAAFAAHASERILRGPPLPGCVRDLRLVLSIFATAAVLWAGLPSVSRPLAGWIARQIAATRYSD